ncbi:hypothetical protein BDD12DRAFT_723238 [Trichophaea hybrida]|nr:hypothetical protein BDD12DRAFT_723238 [Trichophaea hybrida]
MRLTLKQLAEIAILYDQNGVDLYFVSGQENLRAVLRSQNVEVLLGALDRNIPPPAKFVGLSLKVDKLLSNYVQRYISAKERAEHDDMDVDFTNLNLIILTDGRSLLDDIDFRELKKFISVWAKRLDTLAAPISQVGMQFVMINGSDEAPAWKKMKDLDDNLHGKGTIR